MTELSPIEAAQAEMDAQKDVAPVAGGKDKVKKEDELEDPKPAKRPKNMSDLGFCRVGVTIEGLEGENHLVVTDPGFKHSANLGGFASEDPEDAGKAYLAMARALSVFKIPALRNEVDLGIDEGQPLPNPAEFVREHINEWEAWRTEKHRIAKEDGDIPDPPQTKLVLLFEEALPARLLTDIASAIQWAIAPEETEGSGTDEGN